MALCKTTAEARKEPKQTPEAKFAQPAMLVDNRRISLLTICESAAAAPA
jgi:hypothetical protein